MTSTAKLMYINYIVSYKNVLIMMNIKQLQNIITDITIWKKSYQRKLHKPLNLRYVLTDPRQNISQFPRFVVTVMNNMCFECMKKTFNNRIIKAVSSSTHALP